MRSAIAVAITVGVGLFAACGDDQPAASTEDSQSAPCEDDSLPLVLEPDTARAGQRFTVHFSAKAPRTQHLTMSRMDGSVCKVEFVIASQGDKVTWAEVDGPNFIVQSSPRGLASHPAVVPTAAKPGTYEVCEVAVGRRGTPACGVLNVEE